MLVFISCKNCLMNTFGIAFGYLPSILNIKLKFDKTMQEMQHFHFFLFLHLVKVRCLKSDILSNHVSKKMNEKIDPEVQSGSILHSFWKKCTLKASDLSHT